MKVGISTSSFFGRLNTENALKFLGDNNVTVAEVFLESYCEYCKKFGRLLNKVKGKTEINSIHTLNTQFEPQLYSINDRAKKDSFALLERTMEAAECIHAKYYTFHGVARYKKTPLVLDMDRIAKITQRIIDVCAKHGVVLAYENVHWCYYNYIGFFGELKKHTCGLKGTLDIKQARQCGIDYREFIKEMSEDIVTVHISDIDKDGKMCLPLKGIFDFKELFTRLRDVGFDGAVLLEVYQNDYVEYKELLESVIAVRELADKIFA